MGKEVRCSACQAVFGVPPGSGQVRIEWGPEGTGRRVPLSPPAKFTIGRAEDNTLPLAGAMVSRRHAEIAWDGEGWVLRDLGSGNGTFVDGERVREARLTNGTGIIVGDFALRVSIADPASASEDTTLDALAIQESHGPSAAVAHPPGGARAPGAAARRPADPRESTVVGLSHPQAAGGPPARPAAHESPLPTAPARPRPAPEGMVVAVRIVVGVCAVVLAGVLLFLLLRR